MDIVTRLSSAADVDALVDLYVRCGFLQPGRVSAIGGPEAARHILRARLLESSIYRVWTAYAPDGRALAACTFARFSPDDWWFMYLACERSTRALVAALVADAAVDSGLVEPPADMTAVVASADRWLAEREPGAWSMLACLIDDGRPACVTRQIAQLCT